ncbi:MAG TPA: LCP family protein [Clostridia bacterium]
MNTRKLCLILSVSMLIMLFIPGCIILAYLSSTGNTHNGITGFIPPFISKEYVNDILSPFMPGTEPVNILLLGGDKVAGNTDTMIIVNYNPSTAKICMLSIPRDTKVHVKRSSIPKINAAYPVGGGKLALDTVSNFFGVNIKYYIYIDTSVFRNIIDKLDGVDIDVPTDMNYDDPLQNLHIHLKKGHLHMDGTLAEEYMRFRQPSHYTNEIMKYYDGSDLKRIDAQQGFIKELIKQKSNLYYFSKLNSVLSVIYKSIETNLSLEDALKLTQNISSINPDNITMLKLPGDDSEESEGWYYICNKDKSSEIITKYFSSSESYINNSDTQVKETLPESASKEGISKKSVESGGGKTSKTKKQGTISKKNPSNSESTIGGTCGP